MSVESRQKNLQKHIVKCPHCGGDALDHMTKCPNCGEKLTPKGYSEAIPEEVQKKIRIILGVILAIIAIAIYLTTHLR